MLSKSFNLVVNKNIKPYKKIIEVDSDKSISIRSFLIGSISQNISFVKNVLVSEDVLSTIKCLKKLGVFIKKKGRNSFIHGKGLGSLKTIKNTKLNFGNSGTLARLLIGILTTTPDINVKIQGDSSLNKRSMKNLIKLMSEFGASFFLRINLIFLYKCNLQLFQLQSNIKQVYRLNSRVLLSWLV